MALMVAQAFNPSAQEAEASASLKFEVRATEKPCMGKLKQTNHGTVFTCDRVFSGKARDTSTVTPRWSSC